jgi:deoxyribonuclease V
MILAADVDYRDDEAVIAGVLFESWNAASCSAICKTKCINIAAYEPGKFFKRELPCILQLIEEHALQPDVIVIDGYVYLDGISKPGLGKYIYDALDRKVPVIGVAKNPFNQIDSVFSILRGNSTKPLFVTCEGYNLEEAKRNIISMHGQYRIPTLLKLADSICREKAI